MYRHGNGIGVRRGGGQGGPGPPNNLRGGANIPFGPPNNPPTCTGKSIPLNSILEFSIILYIKMRNVIIWHLFIKIYWAHDVEMTSMRRRYVASTSLRRHVPAGNLAPPWPPPNILNLGPPNILNLPTPMNGDVISLLSKLEIQLTKSQFLIMCEALPNWERPCTMTSKVWIVVYFHWV